MYAEHGAVRVALHLRGLRGLVLEAEELEHRLEGCGANRDDACEDGCDDRRDREPTPKRQLSPVQSDDCESERGERDAEGSAQCPGERRSGRAADTGDEAPAAAQRPLSRQCERDQRDRERGAGQGREVVDADERRLPLSRAPSLELVDQAEKLEQPPRRRGHADEDERREEQRAIPRSPQQQQDRRREQRVLAELQRRHQMRLPRIVVFDERRPERACDHEPEEEGNRNEHRGRGAKNLRAPTERRESGNDDRCDREVGELRAGTGDSESDVGLVANVQKEQRAHGREEHRTEAKVARECGLVQGKSSA